MAKVKDLPKDEKPKGADHRKRLRTRFMKADLDGFLDYVILHLGGALPFAPR